MPTMPASGDTRPRMPATSSRTSASGSGSLLAMGFRGVEVALQDEGRGERIDVPGLAGARARLAQLRFGARRGERLVHEDDGYAVARGEAARELLREARDLVRRAVGMAWAPDHEARGLPFLHQLPDRLETHVVRDAVDVAHGIGDADRGLADRDADAPLTEVETDERAAQRHACPASSERLAAFTPSASIAAS